MESIVGPSNSRGPLSRRARQGWLRASLAVLIASIMAVTGLSAPAFAQSPPSAEEAILGLIPYKLPAEGGELSYPEGYGLTLTFGRSNVGFALEWEDLAPEADRGKSQELLTRLEAAGRIVGVRQYVENWELQNQGDEDQVITYVYNAALFRSAEAAAAAVRDPSLFAYLYPTDIVSVAAGPEMGDASAAYWIEPAPDQDDGFPMYVGGFAWQRGPMVFSLHVNGTDGEHLSNSAEELISFASRIDARNAAITRPATSAAATAPQVDPARQFAIAHRLLERLPDETLLGNRFEDWGVVPIDNVVLLLPTDTAAAPFNDASQAKAQFATTEQHVITVGRDIQNKFDPPESTSQFPNVTLGISVYGSEAGAQAALSRPLAALATRLSEENRLGYASDLELGESASSFTLGQESRLVTIHYGYPDGSEISGQSLRWRRGAMELYVTATVEGTESVTERLQRVATELDRRVTATPLTFP